MRRLLYWIAERLRPWHDNGLDEELQFPDEPRSQFEREAMLRHAAFGALGMGIFGMIGQDYAARAASAWRPRELLLMEDLSLAFQDIEEPRLRGVMVDPIRIDRLTRLLVAYFHYIGTARPEAEVRSLVNGYVDGRSVADPAPDLAHPKVDHPLLQELWLVDKEIRERFPCTRGDGRDPGLGGVGLILDKRLDASRYLHCTPLNCRTFASTGGEGFISAC